MKSARQGRLARSTIRIQCKKEKKGDERHKCLEKNCRQKEGRSRKDEDLME